MASATGHGGMGGGRQADWWIRAAWAGALGLWLLAVAGKLALEQMDWGVGDFVAWGLMLAVAAGSFSLAARAARAFAHRAAAVVAIGAAFLLVWINLAVGFIGDEGHPANLMYAGVLLVGVTGALIARGRPQGMARAMFATAIAHGLVGAIALLAALDTRLFVTTANAIFVAIWLLSAALFRSAAQARAADD